MSHFESYSRTGQPILFLAQFIATIALIIFIENSVYLALCLAIFWLASFYPGGTRREFAYFLVTSVVFTFANYGALRAGTFLFHQPDILLMPWNELGMWGFYCLNARRVVGKGDLPDKNRWVALSLAALFAISFSVLQNEIYLTVVLALIFLLALFLFHGGMDIKYVLYFAFMGFVVEFYGLTLDVWSYPRAQFFEWPLWGPLMWLNIGWIIARVNILFFPPKEKTLLTQHIVQKT